MLVTEKYSQFRALYKNTRMVYFQRGGSLVIQNSSFIAEDNRDSYSKFDILQHGDADVDRLTSIQCSIGYQLKMERPHQRQKIQKGGATYNVNSTSQNFYCQRCGEGFYSLERGRSEGLSVVKGSSCSACSYGASCFKGITSKTNFWGYMSSDHPPTLRFIPCPHEYCHRYPKRRTSDYNSCYGNRTGVLCGRCSKGYTEDLFTTECREEAKCSNGWFWILTIAYTGTMALYFVFKPPVIHFLYQNIFWFNDRQAPQQIGTVKHHSPGYIKVIFLFLPDSRTGTHPIFPRSDKLYILHLTSCAFL